MSHTTRRRRRRGTGGWLLTETETVGRRWWHYYYKDRNRSGYRKRNGVSINTSQSTARTKLRAERHNIYSILVVHVGPPPSPCVVSALCEMHRIITQLL